MIYLYWYLGIGGAVLAVVYGAHRLTKEQESASLRELLEAVNPERKRLYYRTLTTSLRRCWRSFWLSALGL